MDYTTQVKGMLEVERSSCFSWWIAFVLSMGLMMLMIWLFVAFTTIGIHSFQRHIEDYQKGAMEVVVKIGNVLKLVYPAIFWDDLVKKTQDSVQSSIPALAAIVLNSLQGLLWNTGLFVVYLLLWVCEPLPVSTNVAQVFKRFLILKSLNSLIYAGLNTCMLWAMGCKIYQIAFVIIFLLNYIPEVGPMFGGMLMIPSILFDGSMSVNRRCWRTFWLIILGMTLKVVMGSIIEVRMYARRGGRFMRMHPVILCAVMMLCSVLLGVTGMFLAIPIMAALKYYLLAANMPDIFLSPLLTIIEGDAAGPHKNFVDRLGETESSPCRRPREVEMESFGHPFLFN